MRGWQAIAMQIMLVALAGAVGTLCRYGLSELVNRLAGNRFAWATLLVNAIGCLLFGIVWGLSEQRLVMGPGARLVILTGFMGAFTTFSTFAFESHHYLQSGQVHLAVANIVVQNVLGLLCVFAGMQFVR